MTQANPAAHSGGTALPGPSRPARVSLPTVVIGLAFRGRRPGWLLVLLVLALWQVRATVSPLPELPPLSDIALEWWGAISEGSLLPAVVDTLRVTSIGYALAGVAGISIGFLMGRVRAVWSLLEPAVELMRSTPVTALLPLLILFLGIGDELKVAIVALVAFFPILLNSLAGSRSVSQTMQLTARTFRLSWWQTQVEVAFPAALPYILTGLRQALALSLVMAVVTGMFAGNSGVGYFILEAQQLLNVRALFAGLITIALIGYALNGLFLRVEHYLTRWRRLDPLGE